MSSIYPLSTSEIARKRRDLAPNQQAAFEAFSKAVFANGALSTKIKQIIAVAVAHVTQCPYCINGHTKLALHAGATPEELTEAIWAWPRARTASGEHPRPRRRRTASAGLTSHLPVHPVSLRRQRVCGRDGCQSHLDCGRDRAQKPQSSRLRRSATALGRRAVLCMDRT